MDKEEACAVVDKVIREAAAAAGRVRGGSHGQDAYLVRLGAPPPEDLAKSTSRPGVHQAGRAPRRPENPC